MVLDHPTHRGPRSGTSPGRGASPRGAGARWRSADTVVPGVPGHDGYDLRDFFLDITLAPDGTFLGSHTTYIIDGKPDDDPADVTRFRYRRSHVLLGYAYGHLDLGRGAGAITIEGYGHSALSLSVDRAILTLRLRESVITYCPVLYTRAVLLRQR
ncbi:MAG TPA: hypothetical protein VLH10_16115 [Yinghuangia sp.]|uniref:hypothetical protein n=1 Tax=Yinghuangia sp. YIM S10712 TaxID=3436930 RepID=UPI002BA7C721|nr:hypothetical protein [Yinghuangia sp.]